MIQRDAVPNIANLDPFFANQPYDPGGVYSVAYQWGTTGLGVNLSLSATTSSPAGRWSSILTS
jgi:spermidine/putrescine transport system substrate-binding protein